jgi:catechol 2,3-dioxygenase-like lactoylglutathione lyase family enzyme
MTHANPINIARIDHVVFRVNDLDKMIAFYRDVLGCKLERGPGDTRLAQLRAGQSLLDLVDANSPLGRDGGAEPDRGAPNVDHVCFLISPWDTDSVLEHLQKQGIAHGEVDLRYGATGEGPSLYLCDPEGNNIELKGG